MSCFKKLTCRIFKEVNLSVAGLIIYGIINFRMNV